LEDPDEIRRPSETLLSWKSFGFVSQGRNFIGQEIHGAGRVSVVIY
jgi:hypothetical protein